MIVNYPFSHKDLPYFAFAAVFIFEPSKSRVLAALRHVAVEHGYGEAAQWALLVFASSIPVLLVAAPIYRNFKSAVAGRHRRWAIAIAAFFLLLVSYCTVRVLYWVA